jgi:hypothetical protein
MNKDRRTQVLTTALLLAACGFALAQKTGWRPSDIRTSLWWPASQPKDGPNPQDVIYAMLDAARAGNVRAYLASYTGQTEAALRQTLAETTEPDFAKYLKDLNASVKGIALSDTQKITDLEAKVRVEYIYQDRNEVQIVYLKKGADGWKISGADSDARVKTLIPYGTPVK